MFYPSSGTGKSSLLKQILRSNLKTSKRPVYCVNVGADQLSEFKSEFGAQINSTTFNLLSATKPNATIIIEDIIYLSPADEKLLRKCLNFDAHHKAQKIFCVTHSVHKTAVWSLLPFFHFLIFSSSPSNKPLLRTCLKSFFKIEETTVNNWLDQFLTLGKPELNKNCYFYFDTNLMKFYFTPNLVSAASNSRQLSNTSTVPNGSVGSLDSSREIELEKQEQKKKQLEIRFIKFTEGHDLKLQAAAVFSILINCLDLSLVRDHDLTINFHSNLSKISTKRISLVDYVLCLLEPTNKKPSQDLIVLHNYLKSFCSIPSIFVNNVYFKNFPLV